MPFLSTSSVCSAIQQSDVSSPSQLVLCQPVQCVLPFSSLMSRAHLSLSSVNQFSVFCHSTIWCLVPISACPLSTSSVGSAIQQSDVWCPSQLVLCQPVQCVLPFSSLMSCAHLSLSSVNLFISPYVPPPINSCLGLCPIHLMFLCAIHWDRFFIVTLSRTSLLKTCLYSWSSTISSKSTSQMLRSCYPVNPLTEHC